MISDETARAAVIGNLEKEARALVLETINQVRDALKSQLSTRHKTIATILSSCALDYQRLCECMDALERGELRVTILKTNQQSEGEG